MIIDAPKIMTVNIGKCIKEGDTFIMYDYDIQAPEELLYNQVSNTCTEYNSVCHKVKYILYGKIYYLPYENQDGKGHYMCDVMDWMTGV